MADILRTEQYLAAIAGESTTIPEKPLTRIEEYLAAIYEHEHETESYTKAQIDAKLAEKQDEITAQDKLAQNLIVGFGTNYIELANGVRLYISDTTPTGDIPEGSLGIGF